MKPSHNHAFTLVEVLTGFVVIAAISACSWIGVSTVFRTEQISRNRNIAINLLQKSQEELRKASLTFYDKPLERCQFPGPSFGTNDEQCGLQALGAEFSQFTRRTEITQENNSPELKKAIVYVTWNDNGKPVTMNSAVLIARPPDLLPGSIYGNIRSSKAPNDLINGATITITLNGLGTTFATSSTGSLGGKSENFDFVDPATGAFKLPPGSYQLTAKATGYYDYTFAGDVVVTSNAETQINPDLFLDPKPEDATIKINLIDFNTKAVLPNFSSGRVYVHDDGNQLYSTGSPSSTATINFSDTNPKVLTIDTRNAYVSSGYVGKTQCTYAYDTDGWSSSVMLDDQSTLFNCGNPWKGSSASDRITINPGEINKVVNVPLYPIPTAVISGTVQTSDPIPKPLAGAKIYARWPTGVWWAKNGSTLTAVTDANGKYTFTVPAVQEMFAQTSSLQLRAEHNMPVNGCCDSQTQILQYGWLNVSDVHSGDVKSNQDITINYPPDSICGNVQGVLKDDASGLTVNGVSISVRGTGTTTSGSGNYIYQCPATGYRLPIGNARLIATQSQYYRYDTAGNDWYSPAPYVNIKANQMVNYDARIWPIGRGIVDVTVIDKGTKNPINGAIVKLKTYNGGTGTLTTLTDGKATFNNTLETWPPPNLPADPYYNHAIQQHQLDVSHPSGFYSSHSEPIPVLIKNDTLSITVELDPGGGT